MIQDESVATLSVFGGGKYRSKVSRTGTTVAEILGEHGVTANGRRLALNGHTTGTDSPVHQGDELTLVPRVQGG